MTDVNDLIVEENDMVETSITGLFVRSLTWGENADFMRKFQKAKEQNDQAKQGYLLCSTYLRDGDGEELEQLKSLETFKKLKATTVGKMTREVNDVLSGKDGETDTDGIEDSE